MINEKLNAIEDKIRQIQELLKPSVGYFLDNDSVHILFFNFYFNKKKMTAVHVNDEEPHKFLKEKGILNNTSFHISNQQKIKNSYIEQLLENKKIKKNSTYISNEKKSSMSYMPTPGITDKHIEALMEWVNLNKNNNKYVFFDWDRTLSCVEGFVADDLSNYDPQDILDFCMATRERQEMLRNMYNKLVQNKVNVYILTSNEFCQNIKKDFLKIIKLIFPNFNDSNLLCAVNYKNKTYRGKKINMKCQTLISIGLGKLFL